MGKDRGKWPRWKFFDQMNFLHTYICHRPDREQAPHGLSIHWEDGKSDCDSNDESSPPHETEKESGIIFEDVNIKREEEEEEEEEDESVRVTKRARLSNNLSTMQEENMRSRSLAKGNKNYKIKKLI
ncbi:hypothetical protein E2C01_089662 [Portunus trituberculatus]|uniref:Uncharacterized protein n=1 Tax=Portunus trituberculatus TaxID=210409 RepID=A0A5B7J9E3_PORTR|nr:hypothetical protein [Portunus trituberculatus]